MSENNESVEQVEATEVSPQVQSLDDILQKPKRRYEFLRIPHWDAPNEICLQTLNGDEQQEFEKKHVTDEGDFRDGVKAAAASRIMVHPETKDRIATDANAGALEGIDSAALTLIWKWFMRNHGYTSELEVLEGN